MAAQPYCHMCANMYTGKSLLVYFALFITRHVTSNLRRLEVLYIQKRITMFTAPCAGRSTQEKREDVMPCGITQSILHSDKNE